MRNLFFSLMIILCFVSVGANAQDTNSSSTLESELKKECGRSGEESDFLIIEEGIVNYINSDNSLIVTVGDKSKIVNLTAISPETNKNAINEFLTKRLLNKNVELNITLSEMDKSQYFATIIENGKDINRHLIENGIAKYQKTEGLLGYTSCVYQQVEKKAKEAKLGFWKTNPGGFSFNCSECGCDGATPSRWDIIRGEVTSIVDSNTIILKAENKIFTIDLIGIATSSNKDEGLVFLQKTLLNQRVNISVKWQTEANLQNAGIVYVFESMLNVNAYLLKNGLAKYKKIAEDALDDASVTDCEFKLFEKKAKEAKLGIWAK